ncbi:hypothetical protein SAMN05192583_1779 [Sphingomonas gellani]|uniref:Uncharacterized protein n=1 Tax=Sphingomonas gellani TaxID=1166340 RepID=A0A1H8CVY3_9SPHN|nr:hypothetical protein [Sphingomonas gellani]SEM99371.1 hypothetical protein SAMN05192583_1779 [Sphingomonas gellani]
MRKLLPFLACLMLVLTGWSAMAHAAEEAGGRLAGVELVVHAPGDGDEVPADGDNGLPHHHSICHGHDLGVPPLALAEACRPVTAGLPGGRPTRMLTATEESVAQRPPRA